VGGGRIVLSIPHIKKDKTKGYALFSPTTFLQSANSSLERAARKGLLPAWHVSRVRDVFLACEQRSPSVTDFFNKSLIFRGVDIVLRKDV